MDPETSLVTRNCNRNDMKTDEIVEIFWDFIDTVNITEHSPSKITELIKPFATRIEALYTPEISEGEIKKAAGEYEARCQHEHPEILKERDERTY